MIAYRYRAAARSGRQLRGRAQATDLVHLARQLEAQGLILVHAAIDKRNVPNLSSARRYAPRAVLEITRGLASLLRAGVPLSQALRTIADVAPGSIQSALHQVREDIDQGRALADALVKHGHLIPASLIGVVRAGEHSGNLPDCFEQLTQYLEREAGFRARILSALTYPAVLLFAGALALSLMFIFVLPRFVELVTEAGAELPRTTSLLISAAEFFKLHWSRAVVALLIVITTAVSFLSSDQGRHIIARVVIASPVIGPLRMKFIAARFARLCCTLLRGGASVYAALGQIPDSLDDPLAGAAVERMRSEVRRGMSFSSALTQCQIFPPVLSQLTAIGEESGRLPEFLEKAAELFERDMQNAMERLVTLIEPAMIVIFGGTIGFIALSLLQAVYSLNTNAL